MKAILSILLAAGAATAMAPVQAQAPGQPPAAVKFPGVSDPGNAILAKAQNAPDPQMAAAIRQIQTVRSQLGAAATEPTIDVAKVAALLKQQQAANAAAGARQTDRLIAVLGQLSPADRSAFLRALVNARMAPGGAAPH